METKKSNSPKRQTSSYPTLLSNTIKAFGSLILFSFVGWVLLLAWFEIKALIKSDYDAPYFLHQILQNQVNFINYHQSKVVDIISIYFKKIEYINYSVCSYLSNHQVIKNFIDIAFRTMEIIIARICTFTMAMPFIMVIFGLFAIDGLVQRDIRKFQGERESTLFFHRSTHLSRRLFVFVYLLFMSSPISISPELIVIPMSFIHGLIVMLSIKNFKKYM